MHHCIQKLLIQNHILQYAIINYDNLRHDNLLYCTRNLRNNAPDTAILMRRAICTGEKSKKNIGNCLSAFACFSLAIKVT